MPKKILYIMHLDWRWIKQRPHFIAEGLSEFYNVKVVHFISKHYLLHNYDISTPNKKNLSIIPALRLPLYQNKIIYTLNKIYMKFYFKLLIKKYDPDFIWITFPQIYDYIPANTNCKIIYDCMDLATGNDFHENFKSKILELEEKLVNDASKVFVSSNYLFKRLEKTYECGNKLFLIRNAFSGEILDDADGEVGPKNKFKIGYVGSISQWIDFEKIEITLDKIGNIEYHLIGPFGLEDELKLDRIKFYGAINYIDIYDYVKNFDCLIVPFKVDDKIRSADPGKLYGYINYNKPIISVYYEELDYFSQFVYFYSNIDEFLNLLNHMVVNGFVKNYSKQERIEFLKNNSWEVRISEIIRILSQCIEYS